MTKQSIDDLADFSRPEQTDAGDNFSRICWTIFWADIGLALFKITIGAFGYSRLLIADGLNSAGNAIVIATILIGTQMSRSETVNREYPYGKGKAQYIITLIGGFILAAGASAILAVTFKRFSDPYSFEPVGIGMATALLSICGNLTIVLFLRRSNLDQKEQQDLTEMHSLNIGASFVVIQGLFLGGVLGWVVAERVGSLSISLIALWLSIKIIKSSMDGVMDRSIGQDNVARISELAESVDGVEDVQFVRTRMSGQILMVDLQVGLKSDTAMSRVDQVREQIRELLLMKIKMDSNVTVHCLPV